jgi:hypothetical protein
MHGWVVVQHPILQNGVRHAIGHQWVLCIVFMHKFHLTDDQTNLCDAFTCCLVILGHVYTQPRGHATAACHAAKRNAHHLGLCIAALHKHKIVPQCSE